ncbi:hypothetical protein ACQFYA_20500 [Promicromonospora sp. Marseille-Q5078]
MAHLAKMRPVEVPEERPARGMNVWFFLILALMIASAMLVPGLSLVWPLVGLLTPLRRSRWRMACLWGLGGAELVRLWLGLAAWDGTWPDWLVFDSEDPVHER